MKLPKLKLHWRFEPTHRTALSATLTLATWLLTAPPAPAQPDPGPVFTTPESTIPAPPRAADTAASAPASPAADAEEDDSPRRARRHPRFKSDLWLPLPSVLLPGFGQYFQGDWTGAVYSGIAVGGALLQLQGVSELINDDIDNASAEDPAAGPVSEDPSIRKILLGGLAYQGSGFMSAYTSFRSSVPRFQQEDGKYLFLTRSEPVGDLLISPFRFDHLLQPTTFVPLALLGGAAVFLVDRDRGRHKGAHWTTSPDDFLFTGALAYNAGATEEAVFRGWLYPLGYQYMGRNYWLANSAQALLFGAAHYNSESNPVPWPQAALGFYFGWLAYRNQWTLSESIFVHAWWDMILFAATVATTREEPASTARLRFAFPVPL